MPNDITTWHYYYYIWQSSQGRLYWQAYGPQVDHTVTDHVLHVKVKKSKVQLFYSAPES